MDFKALLKDPLLVCRGCSGVVVGVGIAVVIGWYLHVNVLLQILPTQPAMVMSTALALIAGGVALFSLTTARGSSIAAWMGIVIITLSGLNLAEYISGRNLEIDQLFVRSTIVMATKYPGRMAPLTAGCLLILGISLILTWKSQRSARKLITVGVLSSTAGMIASAAMLGYLMGIDTASGWGFFARMAIHTAAMITVLSLGLLVWAWYRARLLQIEFLHWNACGWIRNAHADDLFRVRFEFFPIALVRALA